MAVCALDHIVLDVGDVQRSLDFYQRALGLSAERVEAWQRGEVGFPSLRINESTIIDLVSDSAGQSSPARGNLAHFCLVTDSPNLDQAIQTLHGAGVANRDGPRPTLGRSRRRAVDLLSRS
jgi:catechol 2,3-dioxygenase-like lactoylglutathione lyase family enzyme